VLSGGERNRYALARMLFRPSNFLLLDEPTNHLDMRAKDVLLESLQKFTGTVVFVSHDRYFIDKLATRVFEVGDGKVEVFPGNYEDYLWRKQGATAPIPVQVITATNGSSPQVPKEAELESDARQKRLNPIKLKQMKERCAEVEEEIARLETGIADCENALTTFVSAAETARLTSELMSHKESLQALLEEWKKFPLRLRANDVRRKHEASDFHGTAGHLLRCVLICADCSANQRNQ
jgi:ATP-binding cassette subfamily F protein 3